MLNINTTLESWRDAVEARLDAIQTALYPSDDPLHQACRYALSGRGKRIRPLFVLAAAQACGTNPENALNFAAAVEMVHTYSLVHDDLPCMDDDDIRRGRATTHKIFGEAMALLAGDALLTDASLLIAEDMGITEEARIKAVACLAKAAGGQGMVRGQALDMHWTGRDDFTRQDLDTIHRHKTGALIAASCVLGGLAAGAAADQLKDLDTFGREVGLVFQIVDDCLDGETGTGKSAGKDADTGKLTYMRLMHRDEAKAYAAFMTSAAMSALDTWDHKSDLLKALGQQLVTRQS